jgi:hypothetical protein
MWKHLTVLRELGPCRVASAGQRPVGAGWTHENRGEMKRRGFDVVLREDALRSWTPAQWFGMAYGTLAKGLRIEHAFGHANPYHRCAFPADWWRALTGGADLAVINYSYWSWLPCECPKTLVLHDLLSDFMWGGSRAETRDIATCAHVFVLSQSECTRLTSRGVSRVSWCPPAIQPSRLPLHPHCAMVGSANGFNVEGLRWLESSGDLLRDSDIRVYGGLADAVRHPGLVKAGRYTDSEEPYRDNGIVLFATVQGMGVQIKTIEAFAAGRAIIARRGSVRGLPPSDASWIEVDTPAEAIEWVRRLTTDEDERLRWATRAHTYYDRHLDADKIREQMRQTYLGLARR